MKSSAPSDQPAINLVIQTAFLGDLLLAIPLLTWLKIVKPENPVGLICRKGLGDTFKSLGLVDYVWEIQKGNSKSYRSILENLREFKIDFLLSAHTSFRTTLFCAQIKAEKKITFAKPWNWLFFDERVTWPKQWPEALRLLTLLKNHSSRLKELFAELPDSAEFYQKKDKGAILPAPEWADPHRGWKNETVKALQTDLLLEYGLMGKKWVALFPGSVWATKMWKKQGYVQLGQELQKIGYQVVVMGGPEEMQLGNDVANQIPQAINLCGKTKLIESLALLTNASAVVGNDSSSSHMAAFVGVPVVAVYGPTVLEFGYRPWGQISVVVEHSSMPCRPCGPHGHRRCPLGHHNCMQQLDVSEVLSATLTALGARMINRRPDPSR